jgi:outer membrane protein assembly factor BamB
VLPSALAFRAIAQLKRRDDRRYPGNLSFEHAVESAAVLLVLLGAALLVLWALLRRRRPRLGVLFLVLALLAVAGGAGLGAWAWHETRPRDLRGSPTIEFSPRSRAHRISREEPWPTYGRDPQRTHVSPFRHRPPFRQVWRVDTRSVVEFPPSVAYGRVYVSSFKGDFYALDAATGRVVWRKRVDHCSPASPMLAHHAVYQSFSVPLPCARHAPGARGLVLAWDADTGRELWRHDAAAVETSPLVVGKLVYFGSWDGTFYALSARTGKVRWTYDASASITSSPAYDSGTVFAGTDDGHVLALDAQTGKLRWNAASFSRFGRREYFYAAPTIAYGRVYIGNADGTLYAFGAKSGRLLWAQRAGTYIYTAAAVWDEKVYVGTWDGYFSAFDAGTGDLRWRHDATGGISGAPTIMAGLVYYSTFGKFTNSHQRHVKDGPFRTYALNARTGKPVWQFPDGQYSPVVADTERVYLVGSESVYGLVPRRQR